MVYISIQKVLRISINCNYFGTLYSYFFHSRNRISTSTSTTNNFNSRPLFLKKHLKLFIYLFRRIIFIHLYHSNQRFLSFKRIVVMSLRLYGKDFKALILLFFFFYFLFKFKLFSYKFFKLSRKRFNKFLKFFRHLHNYLIFYLKLRKEPYKEFQYCTYFILFIFNYSQNFKFIFYLLSCKRVIKISQYSCTRNSNYSSNTIIESQNHSRLRLSIFLFKN